MADKRTMRIGNLGAGVQSTACYLLEMEGKIAPCEAWIFADVGEEPKAVYHHLAWLESLGGTRIIRGSRNNARLGDDLIKGQVSPTRHGNKAFRFVSVPAYTPARDHEEREGQPAAASEYGQMQRQCTKDYKIEVIEQAIRRLLGLKHRQRFPKDSVHVQQLFGLSDDEPNRIRRVKKNYATHRWASPVFPLVELGWTREMCRAYLKPRVPHEVPRSACVFCPYRSAIEWEHLKATDPEGWARAVEIDRALRVPGNVVNRGFGQKLYLHRSCLPLEVIDFTAEAAKERAKPKRLDMFSVLDVAEECGGCSSGFCGM